MRCIYSAKEWRIYGYWVVIVYAIPMFNERNVFVLVNFLFYAWNEDENEIQNMFSIVYSSNKYTHMEMSSPRYWMWLIRFDVCMLTHAHLWRVYLFAFTAFGGEFVQIEHFCLFILARNTIFSENSVNWSNFKWLRLGNTKMNALSHHDDL